MKKDLIYTSAMALAAAAAAPYEKEKTEPHKVPGWEYYNQEPRVIEDEKAEY